jgi:DNA-binding IclR family transcriptional regulator
MGMVNIDGEVHHRVAEKADLTVRSVLTALDIVDCFLDDEELGVSEIGRRLGVPKSTVYRLLLTLSQRGLVARNPETNKYRLGFHIYELGAMAIARHKLRKVVLPFLEDVQRRTGATVQLNMPDGVDILVVERIFSAPKLEHLFPPQRRMPSHATSSGKLLAAHNSHLAEARRRAGFPKLTAWTTSNVVEFDRSITLARERGYSMMFNEVLPGLASVGAPIFDSTGQIVAALSLIDVSMSVQKKAERLAAVAVDAARKISSRVILPVMGD